MHTIGVDIRKASHELQSFGVETGERKLRQYLIDHGVIKRTQFGYEVMGQFKGKGLFITDNRHHVGVSESGHQVNRTYCVVLITPDGMLWLQQQLGASAESRFFNEKRRLQS